MPTNTLILRNANKAISFDVDQSSFELSFEKRKHPIASKQSATARNALAMTTLSMFRRSQSAVNFVASTIKRRS